MLTSHGYEAAEDSVKVLVERFGRDPSGIDYRCFLRALERHIQHTPQNAAATVGRPFVADVFMDDSVCVDVKPAFVGA